MSTIAIGSPAKPAEAEAKYWGLLAAAALLIVCLLPTPKDLPVAGQFVLGMLLFSVIL